MRLELVLSVFLCAVCASASTTMSHGIFDVTFYNNGDNDYGITGGQDWTTEQMSDVAFALDTWQSRITNTPGRQLQVHLFWTELDYYGSNVLAGSASDRISDGTTLWNLGEYVWKEETDPGYGDYGYDTVILYDTTAAGQTWNFGTAAPASGEIDFRSIITHELGHSLGWDHSYSSSNDSFGWIGDEIAGLTDWEKNLVDGSGNSPSLGGVGTPGNFNQADNPVYFYGEKAMEVYGEPVPIYAPRTFSAGSSLSHLDENALGDLLMSPFLSAGQMVREVSELEWAIMEDIGWSVVPEPAMVILLIAGGLAMRSRQKKY